MAKIVCPKCGHENDPESAFCAACGAKLGGRIANDTRSQAIKASRMKKVGIAAGIILLLLIAAIVVFFMNSNKEVNVDLTSGIPRSALIITGVDGEGKLEIDEVAMKNAADYPAGDKKAEAFMETVKYDVNKDSALSNGDVITVIASYSKETAAKYNINVKNDPRKFEVTTLTEGDDEDSSGGTTKNKGVTINLYGADAQDVYDNYDVPVEDYDITSVLTEDQAQKAINDIFARHGYIFSNKEWQAYYESKPWYSGAYRNQADAKAEMTETEKRNIEYLIKIRDGR